MSMFSTPVSVPSVAKCTPVASWGVPYDRLRKRKTRPDLLKALLGMQKWTAAAVQLLSGMTLKDTDERKSS